MLQCCCARGQPSGTHGRPRSNGSLHSMGTWAQQNSDGTCLWGGQKPPTLPTLSPAPRATDPGPFHLSRGKNTKRQGPTRLYLSLLGVCMVLCPLGRG